MFVTSEDTKKVEDFLKKERILHLPIYYPDSITEKCLDPVATN